MSLEIRQQIKIKGATLSEDPVLYFDNIGPASSLAAITVDSFGGGNSGELIIQNAQSGTLTQALRIGQSGSVYIGTGTIDTSAVLQIDSLIEGFLPPRNADPGTNIVTPAPGLMAYDSTDNEMQYYNGSSWVSLVGGVSDNIATADLTLTGNRRLFGAFDLVFPELTGFQVVTDSLNIAGGTNSIVTFNDAFIRWDDANSILRIDGSGTYDGVYIGDPSGDHIAIEGNNDLAIVASAGDAGAYAINNGFGGSVAIQLKASTTFNSTLEVPEASGTIALLSDIGGVNPFHVITNSAPLTETVDWNNGESQEVDFELKGAGAVVFTLSNPVNGQSYTLKITQGANLNTIAWPASILWEGGTDLVPTAINNAVDVVTMVYNGSNYYASYGTNFN